MLDTDNHSTLILTGKAEAYQSGALAGLLCNDELLALPQNIMQGWKWMRVADILAFDNMATITARKCL